MNVLTSYHHQILLPLLLTLYPCSLYAKSFSVNYHQLSQSQYIHAVSENVISYTINLPNSKYHPLAFHFYHIHHFSVFCTEGPNIPFIQNCKIYRLQASIFALAGRPFTLHTYKVPRTITPSSKLWLISATWFHEVKSTPRYLRCFTSSPIIFWLNYGNPPSTSHYFCLHYLSTLLLLYSIPSFVINLWIFFLLSDTMVMSSANSTGFQCSPPHPSILFHLSSHSHIYEQIIKPWWHHTSWMQAYLQWESLILLPSSSHTWFILLKFLYVFNIFPFILNT